MSVLAAVRPDEWNLPLFVHVLGAMVLVGALVLAVTQLVVARRADTVVPLRLGFRALLYAALPAYVVMRASAEWVASEENVSDSGFAWVDIGYMTAEGGLLLILIATLLAGLRLRRAGRDGTAGGSTAATALVSIVIVAYLVAIWAMTTKPI